MNARKSPIAVILTVTTGHLLCDFLEFRRFLDWMTGDSVMTHQIPRIVRECAPHILKQHPQLSGIDAAEINRNNWQNCLSKYVEEFGADLEISPLLAGEHTFIDPLEELRSIVPDHKILLVNFDDQEKRIP